MQPAPATGKYRREATTEVCPGTEHTSGCIFGTLIYDYPQNKLSFGKAPIIRELQLNLQTNGDSRLFIGPIVLANGAGTGGNSRKSITFGQFGPAHRRLMLVQNQRNSLQGNCAFLKNAPERNTCSGNFRNRTHSRGFSLKTVGGSGFYRFNLNQTGVKRSSAADISESFRGKRVDALAVRR